MKNIDKQQLMILLAGAVLIGGFAAFRYVPIMRQKDTAAKQMDAQTAAMNEVCSRSAVIPELRKQRDELAEKLTAYETNIPQDLDSDGICDGIDTDDDDDGWSDELEFYCETDAQNGAAFPIDSDDDGLCNVVDNDDDDDGVPDDEDGDPLDPEVGAISTGCVAGGNANALPLLMIVALLLWRRREKPAR